MSKVEICRSPSFTEKNWKAFSRTDEEVQQIPDRFEKIL